MVRTRNLSSKRVLVDGKPLLSISGTHNAFNLMPRQNMEGLNPISPHVFIKDKYEFLRDDAN